MNKKSLITILRELGALRAMLFGKRSDINYIPIYRQELYKKIKNIKTNKQITNDNLV